MRRLGADIEEQIAGLLHDISHTAFSHVIDWVLGDPTKKDYQDNNHINIFENSNLPEILEKYGFDTEQKQTAYFSVQSVSNETGFSSVSPKPQ